MVSSRTKTLQFSSSGVHVAQASIRKERKFTKLTPRKNRSYRWERVHDERKSGPGKKYDIREQSDRAHPERTVTDVVSTADEEADDRDGV